MPYEFSNRGISLLYADIINGSADLSSITSSMQSNFRNFLSNYFNLSTDQSNYISNIPDEILTNIANNLAHCLNNNYSISLDIDGFAKRFYDGSGSTLATPPTLQNTRLRCHWGNWIEHEITCSYIEHHGLGCSLEF